MKILILAPHPDDETIGMGGTIKKLTKLGNMVSLCIISDGASNKDGDKKKSKVRKEDCKKVAKFLGIKKVIFLDFPDTRLMEIPQVEINSSIEEIIKKTNPEILFIPPENDLHTDHSKVHNCNSKHPVWKAMRIGKIRLSSCQGCRMLVIALLKMKNEIMTKQDKN